jgi:hypothetical protein
MRPKICLGSLNGTDNSKDLGVDGKRVQAGGGLL